jgi:hypothetical protein
VVPGSGAKKAPSSRENSPAEMPHLVRAVHWPNRDGDDAYTSVHVHKEHKEVNNMLYTNERNYYFETKTSPNIFPFSIDTSLSLSIIAWK